MYKGLGVQISVDALSYLVKVLQEIVPDNQLPAFKKLPPCYKVSPPCPLSPHCPPKSNNWLDLNLFDFFQAW